MVRFSCVDARHSRQSWIKIFINDFFCGNTQEADTSLMVYRCNKFQLQIWNSFHQMRLWLMKKEHETTNLFTVPMSRIWFYNFCSAFVVFVFFCKTSFTVATMWHRFFLYWGTHRQTLKRYCRMKIGWAKFCRTSNKSAFQLSTYSIKQAASRKIPIQLPLDTSMIFFFHLRIFHFWGRDERRLWVHTFRSHNAAH